jgi:hypothetical protein
VEVISRAWDYLLDQIAARFNKLREKRIRELQRKIKDLHNYNEHKVLLRLLREIVALIAPVWSIHTSHGRAFRIGSGVSGSTDN